MTAVDTFPAPDIGTAEDTMAWMMDTFLVASGHTVLAVVTGKPVSHGGSLGRASATSRGVVYTSLAALRHVGCEATSATAAVQGFGKVGRGAARFLEEAGVRVVASSDQYVASGPTTDWTFRRWRGTRTGGHRDSPAPSRSTKKALLALDVDLLVPAAVEGVLHAGNARSVRARVVVEGANGPTTTEADRLLEEQGVLTGG